MRNSAPFIRFPELLHLLQTFKDEVIKYIPEHTSSYLFGGITLGEFSPPWSDIDIIVWVDRHEVSDDLIERSFRLWIAVARMTYGTQLYMYVAPLTVVSGPMNPAGGGTIGQPKSLRVYRNKWREMSGYPLSLPDTVCLTRHGVLLAGEDIKSKMPVVHSNWADEYLRIQISHLIQAVRRNTGPFGDTPQSAATDWGPEGIMSYPLWFARHLYSLSNSGEITSKEQAARWYLENYGSGFLVTALHLILKWREHGTVNNPEEVERVATLTRPSTMDFLHHVAAMKGINRDELPRDLLSALEFLSRSV